MASGAIAGKIHRILQDNEAGKSRVVLGPEDVARLHAIAVWALRPACSPPITQWADEPGHLHLDLTTQQCSGAEPSRHFASME